MTSSKSLLTLLFLLAGLFMFGQEICNNGIDDDNDGLVDLNDDDCTCEAFVPSSLIPNPSFEEMTCCPSSNAMLNCANEWIQASAPTTDYIHTCGGYTGNTSINAVAPTPYPDGEGAVGFRDGEEGVGPNFKEYVGACLTEPMVVGAAYRLDFFVGFRDNIPGSLEFDLALFGSTNCGALPFGGNSFSIGCPSNTPQYVQIDQLTVSGNNEWVNIVIEFTPTQPYEVFVLGPACATNPQWQSNPYFYVDRLALAETSDFGFPLDVDGQICEDDLILSVPDDGVSTYQWYKNGVAISGETNSSLLLGASTPNVEGSYSVVVFTADECEISQGYEVRVPPYYAQFEETICESDEIIVGTDTMTQSGYYEITILAQDGCDSIVQLTLDVSPTTNETITDSYCQGDTYMLFDVITTEPGIYEATTTNSIGCDSLITIILSEIPANSGVDVEPFFEIDLGTTVDIIPSNIDPNLLTFSWINDMGALVGNDPSILNYQPTETTTLYLTSVDAFGCPVLDTVLVRVDKENIKIYVPNIFSPNNDNVNDKFMFFPTIALDEVSVFAIYDRWGDKVFEAEGITDANDAFWDGTFNGRNATTGVYAYYLQARFLDGSEQTFKGSITLIR